MGTTAAFVIAKQRGITTITPSQLNEFRNKFVRNSLVPANLTYEQSGPPNSQHYTFTAQFAYRVEFDYVEQLLGRIGHPFAVGYLGISQPPLP